ncbi:MAG: DUF58 domain-containing protein [Deltaproteobacteria bacterium]|nr:DUF58 domain-containing protein [Deltaproteobacteria bacterium]
MIEPTERTLWLLVLVAAVGALGLAVAPVGDAAPFVLAAVSLALLADFALAGSPRRLSVRRVLPEAIVEGRPCELFLEVEVPRPLALTLTDTLPEAALMAGASPHPTHEVALEARGQVRVPTSITFVRRGAHRLGRVAVRTRGPLGLLRRRARLPLDAPIEVLPDIARIGARAERLLRGKDADAGTRRRALRDGREFDSLREYQRGDDPRLVEWKQSARRGQLIVKKLKPETRQDLVIAVDAGRHLSGTQASADGGEPRFDVAITAALTLAAAGLARGDRISFACFAAEVLAWAPPATGRGALRRFADSSREVHALAEEADYGELARFLVARQKRRAMVCLLTDVLDEPSVRGLAGAVAMLRQRHLPVVLALGDPALGRLARSAAEGDDKVERLVPEAAARLLAHRKTGLAALEAAGAVVVDAAAPRAAALAVETYVTLKAQGRL